MDQQKKTLKWAVVIVPVVAAALAIYPPSRKLKAGIDLAGGSSLLFEIDTSGLKPAEKVGLAGRVMEVLKRRVDPNGQMNLIWRPIGNNRLEIQMPRPPKAVRQRRHAWEQARGKLAALNITRMGVEMMLHQPADQRAAALAELSRGLTQRRALLDDLVTAYEAYQNEADDVAGARDAYEKALDKVLETSIDLGRLTDVLALTNKEERQAEITKLLQSHPSPQYRKAIDEAVVRYDAWSANKGVLEDPSDLKRRIRGAGVLEFRILAERDPSSPTQTAHTNPELRQPISKYVEQLNQRGPRRRGNDAYQWFEVGDILDFTNSKSIEALEAVKDTMGIIVEKYTGRWYVLAHARKEFGLLRDSRQKWKLVNAFRGVDSQTGGPAVNFQLDARGGRQFAELTAKNLNKPMVILLDNVAQSYAFIEGMIRENGQIRGRSYTQEKVSELVSTLRAGSLPARLVETPLMENTVGPSLGESNRRQGMQAAVYGGIAVAVFMLIYYLFAGFVADLALALNLLFVLAIMAAMEATFTLPGIAGLILTVGMAVDANVLIFERIREERDRGVGLRKALRTGYERAFSTIVDANLTTLITCIVLGYVGTEEVKGFAMVLGFGIVTSMFTALFVTRLIFTTLLDMRWIKALPMLRILRRPQVDWLAWRRMFWPVSASMVCAALVLSVVVSMTNKEALYDIEFLGGTSVQIELKPGQNVTDESIRRLITKPSGEPRSSVQWLEAAADALGSAEVSRGDTATSIKISSPDLSAEQLEVLVRRELEPKVERGGFTHSGRALVVEGKVDTEGVVMLNVEGVKAALSRASADARKAAVNLGNARIQTVKALEAKQGAPTAFEVITVETNKELVETAILAAMNPDASAADSRIPRLNVERAVSFEVVTDPELAAEGYWPIQEEDQYLSDVLGEAGGNYDIRAFKGGAVIVFDRLDPALSTAAFEKRVREIRLQPEFSQYEVRPFRAIGLVSAGKRDGETVYSKMAYVVVDENLPYYDDPTGAWEDQVAKLELQQASEALGTEKSLRKVNQFAPQVAAQTGQQAILAIALSLAAIVAYIWIRFGQMQFGLAAIVALVHDVSITLGLVALSHYVYSALLGRAFGLSDFKIDLPMIAAFLTIIGYSLNDTIVVFDRIRENRGKLKSLTPAMINNSINQCLSRTVLTSLTTFVAVLIMYLFGGPGIHGFSFALLAGVVVGTYSSIAIAAPLLYRPRVLHVVVYILLALGVFGGFAVIVGHAAGRTILAVAGALIMVALIWAIALEMRSGRRSIPMAGAPA